MQTEPISIIGGGGHAKVVVEALRAAGVDLALLHIRDRTCNSPVLGILVQKIDVDASLARHSVHVAIGDAAIRERLIASATGFGAVSYTIVHPAAVVAASALIGPGSFIAAGAIVGPDAIVGTGVIVNHGAVVDHDAIVGDFTHIAPNAALGGRVQVGARVLMGAGSIALPGVMISDDAIVGAGAVVTRHIGAGTWIGAPARRIGS